MVNSTNAAYPATPTVLTGNGLDFAVSTTPTSGHVIAGYGTTTNYTTTPLGGFNANLQLSCTVTAPGSTCLLSSPAYNSSSAVTTAIQITTTSQYAVIGYGGLGGENWLWIVGLTSGGLLWFGRRRLGSFPRAGLLLVLIAAGAITMSGCSGKLPAKNANVTVPGNYTYTIAATDGFLVRSATYTLNVTAK